jgi:hypothetical protein
MFFLLGVKLHPVIRLALGTALIVAGVAAHMTVLALVGVFFFGYGAIAGVTRLRRGGGQKGLRS